MQQDLRSDLRKELERLLQQYPRGITAADLAQRTQADAGLVRQTISRLHTKGLIRSTDPGKPSTKYVWFNESMAVAASSRSDKTQDDYEPAIHNPPLPGRPKQDDHHQHGSRMGDWIVYRDGTKKHISET